MRPWSFGNIVFSLVLRGKASKREMAKQFLERWEEDRRDVSRQRKRAFQGVNSHVSEAVVEVKQHED